MRDGHGLPRVRGVPLERRDVRLPGRRPPRPARHGWHPELAAGLRQIAADPGPAARAVARAAGGSPSTMRSPSRRPTQGGLRSSRAGSAGTTRGLRQPLDLLPRPDRVASSATPISSSRSTAPGWSCRRVAGRSRSWVWTTSSSSTPATPSWSDPGPGPGGQGGRRRPQGAWPDRPRLTPARSVVLHTPADRRAPIQVRLATGVPCRPVCPAVRCARPSGVPAACDPRRGGPTGRLPPLTGAGRVAACGPVAVRLGGTCGPAAGGTCGPVAEGEETCRGGARHTGVLPPLTGADRRGREGGRWG